MLLITSILLLVSIHLLPDFSRAGCDSGINNCIPNHQIDITDFGAVPNDENDDSIAINKAIYSLPPEGGVVNFPHGTWVLKDRININRNNVYLQGNGSTLFCPKPLADIYGENKNWSWSSGFIVLSPNGKNTTLGKIRAVADDGNTKVEVDWKDGQPVSGEWVQIWWYNDIGSDSLLTWLYGDAIQSDKYGSEMQTATTPRIKSWFKVVSVNGHTLELDSPLPLPANPRWKPTLMKVPHLQNCIVDGFQFKFIESQYPGHLKERGHNCISVSSTVESKIANITTTFADSGIFLNNCGFVTIENVETHGRFMHHPISLSYSSHCLVKNFELNAPHIHGTTISWGSHFNVFVNGKGNALAMDSHRACSFRNLHQNILVQHGDVPKQPLRSGGSYNRGLHAARENVYLNIEHQFQNPGEIFEIKLHEEWPLGIFIGWHGNGQLRMKQALPGQIIKDLNRKSDLYLYRK